MGRRTDLVIRLDFADGTQVSIGGDDELIVGVSEEAAAEGQKTATLNDDRLALIKRVQDAEDGD